MARSAGGSTGAASLATLDATTSEGDTHLSPMLMRTDGAERLDDDALRASPERAAATRAARSSGSAFGMGGAGGAGEARRDAGRADGDEGTKTRTTTRTSNGPRETWTTTADTRHECPRWTRRR